MTTTLLGPLSDSTITAVSTTANWLVLLCVLPMCWSTIRYPLNHPKRAHPPPITWGTWFAVGVVATIGQALGGSPVEAWSYKLFLSLGPLLVAVVAVIRHEPLVADKFDRWCLALSVVGLALYVLIYRGDIGPGDPYAAGLVAVGAAIAVDIVSAGPTWRSALNRHAPITEIITFALALAATLAVICILPVPWTWLTNTLVVFLALQMSSIIVTLWLGRTRNAENQQEEVATP